MMMDIIGKKCYRCTSTETFTDYKCGDIICRNCGEVLSGRIIDDTNEWNIYTDDDRGPSETVARAGITIRDPILDCHTTTSGGSNEKRKSLLLTQNKLENNINIRASRSRDVLFQIATTLHLTPSIQVSSCTLYTFIFLITYIKSIYYYHPYIFSPTNTI